jgi:hypothetical protein
MATGPNGEQRPTDVIGAAVMVTWLPVGDATEELCTPSGKVRGGLAGGRARADSMSKEDRTAVAKKAAAARWG